jgi:hypothetical protein
LIFETASRFSRFITGNGQIRFCLFDRNLLLDARKLKNGLKQVSILLVQNYFSPSLLKIAKSQAQKGFSLSTG